MILTQEQELLRLLVVALHKLGGSMDVTQELLDHMKPYRLVWNPREDQIHFTLSFLGGDVLIGVVDNDVVTVS